MILCKMTVNQLEEMVLQDFADNWKELKYRLGHLILKCLEISVDCRLDFQYIGGKWALQYLRRP